MRETTGNPSGDTVSQGAQPQQRIVIALGGNAIAGPDGSADPCEQRHKIAAAAQIIGKLADHHTVAITHGNGPQIGLLALQALSVSGQTPFPLDDLGALSEGWIGYEIERELANWLPAGREAVTLLTQIQVDPDDPAFDHPAKPVGPYYSAVDQAEVAQRFGWQVAEISPGRFRRVVASPLPLRICEIAAVRHLLAAGFIVICAGGGGIPITTDGSGRWQGAEAVIDKDRSSALLAIEIGAREMLILTDIDAVYGNWQTPEQRPIRQATTDCISGFDFAEGSMGPKVAAACHFVRETGGTARIGHLSEAEAILSGRAGTRIRPGVGVMAALLMHKTKGIPHAAKTSDRFAIEGDGNRREIFRIADAAATDPGTATVLKQGLAQKGGISKEGRNRKRMHAPIFISPLDAAANADPFSELVIFGKISAVNPWRAIPRHPECRVEFTGLQAKTIPRIAEKNLFRKKPLILEHAVLTGTGVLHRLKNEPGDKRHRGIEMQCHFRLDRRIEIIELCCRIIRIECKVILNFNRDDHIQTRKASFFRPGGPAASQPICQWRRHC